VGRELIDRLVLRLCELLEQLLDPAGLRLAGVDDIDINVITVAECSEAFGALAKTCSQASSVRSSPATVTACGPPAAATALAPSARLAELAAARAVPAPSPAKATATASAKPPSA